jgi:RNA polymerase sigma-70 factor (ECF subfamily)
MVAREADEDARRRLIDAFVAHPALPRVAVADVLSTAWDAARAAWPEVHLDPETFAHGIAERLGEGNAVAAMAALHTSDLYLCLACANGDASAIVAFDALLAQRMPQFLARYHASSARCDEVRQRLHERLLVGDRKRIAHYRGRGSLTAWLRVAAVREAIALDRGLTKALAHDSGRDVAADARDPERELILRRHGPQFERALAASLEALRAEQRELLRLYFVEALTLEEIAQRCGVNRSTILRRLRAGREELLLSTRARLAAEIGVSDSTFETVGRLLHADLEISLCRYLR